MLILDAPHTSVPTYIVTLGRPTAFRYEGAGKDPTGAKECVDPIVAP